jgi:Ca2+-binding RTX toxin-like protein
MPAITVTIRNDILNIITDGFDYSLPQELVTVKPDVSVISDFTNAIYSNQADSVLINKGNLIGSSNGVEFDTLAENSSITNALGALIAGYDHGVEMAGHGTQRFTNFGKVTATLSDGLFFPTNDSNIVVNNHGEFLSVFHGIHTDAPGVINNFSEIKGVKAAIHVNLGSDNLAVTINNKAGGILVGGITHGNTSSIDSNEGIFRLNNFGKVVGDINDFSLAANDVVKNHNVIKGDVNLGNGDDFFRNFGNAKSGVISGNDGNDRLIGGNHPDEIHGGLGIDLLTGGNGPDKFVFDTTLNPVTNVDTITDFRPSQHDKIELSQAIFTLLPLGPLDSAHFATGAPVNTNPQIDYNPGTGALVYDPDGTGGTAPILFATLQNHAHITLHPGDLVVIA